MVEQADDYIFSQEQRELSGVGLVLFVTALL
jgi:hypothetical protein